MTQFLVVGLLALAAIVIGARVLTARAANDEAIADARRFTEVLARSTAEPGIPRGLVAGRAGAVDRFDRVATQRLLVDDVRRIKIWNAAGTIVYSDEVRLIGETFELDPEELEILREGGSDAELADLGDPENRFESADGLVEVYTQVWSPEGEPLLFEAYFSKERIEDRQAAVIGPFQRITLGALAVLVVVATVLLWVLTRRAARAAAERERLLRSAATASEAERRRIARDLHDGVVQDLAGSAFALSAIARDAGEPARAEVSAVSASVRESLRALRSLLVEIHPPDLDGATLPAALDDLCAPAASAGVAATVSVDELGEVGPDAAAMVWRVAQEAVRNTLRHARASTLTVSVQRDGAALVLDVTDDGVGFDPAAVVATAHYGLRGLESLVSDHGGALDIRTSPGGGTRVRLEVRA